MRLRRELEARGGSAKVGSMLSNPAPPVLGRAFYLNPVTFVGSDPLSNNSNFPGMF